MTNEEMLLTALANGTPITEFQPQNNKQAYLAYLNGLEIELPEPRTAEEALLYNYCVNGGGGGSGEDDGGEVLKLKDFSYFFADGVHQEYVGKIDTSKATNFEGMFRYFSTYPNNTDWVVTAFPELDTSNGTIFARMFEYNKQSTTFPKMNTSKGTNFYYMFGSCTAMITAPELNTSNGTNFDSMFSSCTAMTTVPEFDTSSGTNFSYMFSGCKKLTTIPTFNTSNGTKFSSMFQNCTAMTTVPELDTSNGTNFDSMFSSCTAMTTAPELNTSNGTNFSSMFSGCTAMTTVPKLDLNKTKASSDCVNLFYKCATLENAYLYNIRKSIQIGSGTTYGHLLTVDSLVHTIKELCTVTSTQTLTMGNANLEKIANLYCKITDDTHEKKPMELCESTDEGAMLLTDYAMEKGWTIK